MPARVRSATTTVVPPTALDVVVHYQPVLDLDRGAVVGVEALARLRTPGGLRAPATFLEAAERDGSLPALGYSVMAQAFAEARRWHDAGHRDVQLLVNLSPTELVVPGVVERVAHELAVSGLHPASLVFEITEAMPLDVHAGLARTVDRLVDTGVGFALDDFGTGYGCLLHLRDLPLVGVKVDQRFVAGLPDDAYAAAVLRAVHGLALARGLWCVAEGVEKPTQRAALSGAGLTLAQGHLLARPLPAERLRALLEDGDGRRGLAPLLAADGVAVAT